MRKASETDYIIRHMWNAFEAVKKIDTEWRSDYDNRKIAIEELELAYNILSDGIKKGKIIDTTREEDNS